MSRDPMKANLLSGASRDPSASVFVGAMINNTAFGNRRLQNRSAIDRSNCMISEFSVRLSKRRNFYSYISMITDPTDITRANEVNVLIKIVDLLDVSFRSPFVVANDRNEKRETGELSWL